LFDLRKGCVNETLTVEGGGLGGASIGDGLHEIHEGLAENVEP